MATTGRPIEILVVGIRDTAGAVIASGKVRAYAPGTLTPRDVFTDDACTAALTQPGTLNAGGQYKYLYALEPIRLRVHDSTDTTLIYDGIVNLNRHDSVYLTHASINGGAETTLETFLGTATTSLGTDLQYKESSTATARNYVDWMGEICVSVKDFGALGDDANNDTTAIQAACDRVEARGGGWVYVPKGIYRITAPVTIDTVGVKIRGAGRGIAVFKQYTTTVNSITVNLGSAVDSKITIQDISITASTTTSGKGIEVINGDRIAIYNVAVALHRSGIDTSAVAGSIVKDCVIESTDDNAAAQGIDAGARGRVENSEVISGTDNGDGIILAADAKAERCYVSNFANGVLMSGARSHCNYTAVTGATVGISVGAVAGCVATFNYLTSNGTDITVNASATLLSEFGNTYSTITNSTKLGHNWMKDRPIVWAINKQTDTGANITMTPDPMYPINVLNNDNATAHTLTVAATSTTGLVDGQVMLLVIQKTGANALTVALNTQYKGGIPNVSANSNETAFYVWRAAAAAWLFVAGVGSNAATDIAQIQW